MKLVNDFLEQYGVDKILHFLVAAYIISMGAIFGLYGFIISWAILIPLMFLKELLDDPFDWNDILWGTMGGVVSTLAYSITLISW